MEGNEVASVYNIHENIINNYTSCLYPNDMDMEQIKIFLNLLISLRLKQ